MAGSEEIDQSIRPLLKLSREHIVRAQKLDYALVSSLERDPLLMERLKRLRTVLAVERRQQDFVPTEEFGGTAAA